LFPKFEYFSLQSNNFVAQSPVEPHVLSGKAFGKKMVDPKFISLFQ